MKKVRLRIVSLFIAVTMLLAMMPSTAMAADEVVKTGQVQNSTIYYELTPNDDGADTLTLRFYETDTNGTGAMPDFAVKDGAEDAEAIDKYQNAPWYDSDYRLKITHVIYDESITRTGYLTATHLYNCAQFDFPSPGRAISQPLIYTTAPSLTF